MEDFTEDLNKIPSITPWENFEVGEEYITPPIRDIDRMSITVLSKDGDTMKCLVVINKSKEVVSIHRTSIAAKFMVKEVTY